MKRSVSIDGMRFTYTLIRASRRDVLFQALPNGEFRVYAPTLTRLKEADALVIANADMIRRLSEKVAVQESIRKQSHPVSEGSEIYIEGMPRTLTLRTGRTHMSVTDDRIVLTVPTGSDEAKIRGILKSQLAKYMLPVLMARLDHYAPYVGVEYGRVAIRDQRSRWGSCSAKHNLNFNWKLIMAPPEVLDYVVVHELCHIHEFNHSPRFWSLVGAQIPDYAIWVKWLKQHGQELGV